MFFKKKYERVTKLDEAEKKLADRDKLGLEKGDIPAMIIAGFIVLIPALLAIIGVVVLLMFLFTGF